MKRAAVLGLVVLLSTVWLRAFDLQYGSLFTVRGITLNKGRPVLPLSRGKYANVRVLDKDTFALLKTCDPSCAQEGVGKIQLRQLRAAKTRPDMWIADVSVDEKWLLTFLVFKNKDGFSFIVPQDVRIVKERWLDEIKALIQTQISNGKK